MKFGIDTLYIRVIRAVHALTSTQSHETSMSQNLMPIMQYEEEGEKLADKGACAGVRADLKMCLLNSDCVKRDKKTPRECLKVTDGSVPIECQALRNTFFECKRSMLDNRTRFRGRKGY